MLDAMKGKSIVGYLPSSLSKDTCLSVDWDHGPVMGGKVTFYFTEAT